MGSSNDRLSNTHMLVGTTPPSGAITSGVAVYRTPNDGNFGNPSNVFNSSGIPVAENDHPQKLAINRVGIFEKEIYLVQSAEVLKWLRGSGSVSSSWQTQVAFSGATAANSNHLGIYPWFDNAENKRYLISAYQVGSGPNWVGVKYDVDADIWTTGAAGSLASFGNNAGVRQVVRHNDDFYFTGESNITPSLYKYSPRDMTFRTIEANIGSAFMRHPVDMAVFNNRLYVLFSDTNRNIRIGEVRGSINSSLNLQHKGSDALAFSSAGNEVPRCLLFADSAPQNLNLASGSFGPSLYAFFHVDDPDGEDGWQIWRLQNDGSGNLVEVETLSELLPSDYAVANGVVKNGNRDAVFKLLKDNQAYFTSSPAQDRILIRPDNNHYSARGEYVFQPDYYKDNAAAWPIVITDATPTPKYAIREDKDGGGVGYAPATFVPGTTGPDGALQEDMDAVYVSGELLDDKETWRIYYRLFPSPARPAGTQIFVRWYFDQNGHAPADRCKIDAATGGSAVVQSGNNILVTMLSGVDYTADWDIGASGLSPSDAVNLAPLVFISGQVPL